MTTNPEQKLPDCRQRDASTLLLGTQMVPCGTVGGFGTQIAGWGVLRDSYCTRPSRLIAERDRLTVARLAKPRPNNSDSPLRTSHNPRGTCVSGRITEVHVVRNIIKND